MSPFRLQIAALFMFILGIRAASAEMAFCGRDDTSNQVIDAFHEIMNQNEQFKNAVADSEQWKYKTLRVQVERDTSTKLIPCMRRAAEILATKKEPQLAIALLYRLNQRIAVEAASLSPFHLGEIVNIADKLQDASARRAGRRRAQSIWQRERQQCITVG